jgi:hypothetical protein
MFETRDIACPYCGERIALPVDASGGAQTCIEDCHVCCRPITVILELDGQGDVLLAVRAEDDA